MLLGKESYPTISLKYLKHPSHCLEQTLHHTHPDAPDITGDSIPPSPKPPTRLLDLFSGTGSVGDVFRQKGYDVISVVIDEAFKPTIVADLISWEYKHLWPEGYFTVIASSPPCTNTAPP